MYAADTETALLLPIKKKQISLAIQHRLVTPLVDTGASVSAMDINLARQLGLKITAQSGSLVLAGAVTPRTGTTERVALTVGFPDSDLERFKSITPLKSWTSNLMITK